MNDTDTNRELGFLEKSAGLVDGPGRAVIEVTGDRAPALVGGLLTNDVEGLGADRSLYAFMLTPKGRPVAEMRVIRRSGGLWLDVPEVCLDAAMEHLGKYLPPRLARFQVAGSRERLSVIGPLAVRALEALGFRPDPGELEPLEAAHAEVPPLGTLVRRESIEGPGFDLYTTEADAWLGSLGPAVEAVGGGPVGPAAYELWRMMRGVPVYGSEIDLDVLPQETGQEKRAVSFTKGCYTGQEVVARIHYRGHVNRHLRSLRFAADAPPSAGAELYDEGRASGRVTSVARHPSLGWIGLGYVRREVEPPAALSLDPDGPAVCAVHELGEIPARGKRKGST